MLRFLMGVFCLFSKAVAEDIWQGPTNGVVGNARDSHNCLLSAGYKWCESTKNCVRPWLNECPTCSDVMCDMYCSNGYELSDNGCPICKCKEVVTQDVCDNWYYKTCNTDKDCKQDYSCISKQSHCLATRCNCKGLCTRDCSHHKGICTHKNY